MKKLTFFTFVFASIVLLLSGCGEEAVQPHPIEEGIDICEVCNMGVADDAFATELMLKNGRVYKFDDIGCMHEWLKNNPASELEATFVRDYHTADWVSIESASFVFDPSFHTPMGYGIYSFKNQSEAKDMIDQEGKGVLLSATDLKQHEWVRHSDHMKDLKKQLMDQKTSSKQ